MRVLIFLERRKAARRPVSGRGPGTACTFSNLTLVHLNLIDCPESGSISPLPQGVEGLQVWVPNAPEALRKSTTSRDAGTTELKLGMTPLTKMLLMAVGVPLRVKERPEEGVPETRIKKSEPSFFDWTIFPVPSGTDEAL